MDTVRRNIVGLIPAAGSAARLGRLPFSKELMPLKSIAEEDAGNMAGVPVAIDYSLEILANSNISRAYIVIAPGKWDIPAYLGDGMQKGLALSYLIARSSPSVPHSLDVAHPFVNTSDVALLFPDIVFRPRNALSDIINEYSTSGADVVLALVPSSKGEKVDIVMTDPDGEVREIIAKPGAGSSGWTWVAAVWNSRITDCLHHQISTQNSPDEDKGNRELYVADVFNAAINDGLVIRTVRFPNGNAVDIGTHEDLQEFWRTGV